MPGRGVGAPARPSASVPALSASRTRYATPPRADGVGSRSTERTVGLVAGAGRRVELHVGRHARPRPAARRSRPPRRPARARRCRRWSAIGVPAVTRSPTASTSSTPGRRATWRGARPTRSGRRPAPPAAPAAEQVGQRRRRRPPACRRTAPRRRSGRAGSARRLSTSARSYACWAWSRCAADSAPTAEFSPLIPRCTARTAWSALRGRQRTAAGRTSTWASSAFFNCGSAIFSAASRAASNASFAACRCRAGCRSGHPSRHPARRASPRRTPPSPAAAAAGRRASRSRREPGHASPTVPVGHAGWTGCRRRERSGWRRPGRSPIAGASTTSLTGLRAAEASATGGWSSPHEAAVVAVRTATAVRAMSRRGRVVLAGRGN